MPKKTTKPKVGKPVPTEADIRAWVEKHGPRLDWKQMAMFLEFNQGWKVGIDRFFPVCRALMPADTGKAATKRQVAAPEPAVATRSRRGKVTKRAQRGTDAPREAPQPVADTPVSPPEQSAGPEPAKPKVAKRPRKRDQGQGSGETGQAPVGAPTTPEAPPEPVAQAGALPAVAEQVVLPRLAAGDILHVIEYRPDDDGPTKAMVWLAGRASRLDVSQRVSLDLVRQMAAQGALRQVKQWVGPTGAAYAIGSQC